MMSRELDVTLKAVIGPTVDYRSWHLPLARDNLAEAGTEPGNIPLMVQLLENPRYKIPGITLFYGRVDLEQHDAIHILLGRGLLNKDEGFSIGFTMGSGRKISTIEEELFAMIASSLYPRRYRLGSDDFEVFRNGLRLAYLMNCKALYYIYFNEFSQFRLCDIRTATGIDTNLLRGYYIIERERYPRCPSSQRLLDV